MFRWMYAYVGCGSIILSTKRTGQSQRVIVEPRKCQQVSVHVLVMCVSDQQSESHFSRVTPHRITKVVGYSKFPAWAMGLPDTVLMNVYNILCVCIE